jgi:diguanylate cyclase (GGDEF)-like protein
MIIGLAAWSLGWAEAIAVGLASLAITLGVNGFQLYPYSGVAGVWNIAMRVAAVLVLIGLLHRVRQMYAREWRLSRTDPLTGALNRKAFFELTGNRTHSRGWSLLVFADFDGFKALNDALGHAAGDECLASFVRHVSKLIRKDDVLARVGGDEFALYLDVKNESAAKTVAARLHTAMNAVALASGTRVKCSVGALILEPGDRSIDREVRGADVLMYEAKGLGSSLVAGTGTDVGGAWSIRRHWELTPEAHDLEPREHKGQVARRSQLRARATGAAGELQQVA